MFKKTITFLGLRISLILLVLILLILAAIAGLMVGYGVLGGGNPAHVFSGEFWSNFMHKLNP